MKNTEFRDGFRDMMILRAMPLQPSSLAWAPLFFAAAVVAAGCWMMAGVGGPGEDDSDDSDNGDDSDGDSDTDSGYYDGSGLEPILMDCTECPSVGGDLLNMVCAIDLCDLEYVLDMEYTSPQVPAKQLPMTYQAVHRFGSSGNQLAPRMNGSYALMATGPAEGTSHSYDLGSVGPVADPFVDASLYNVYDTVEWRLTLRAPDQARAFRFKYVFLSVEYDEFIGSEFNDKFYVIIEAASTNSGEPTVINFTRCRNPSNYVDFVCKPGDVGCSPGKEYCYIAINSAFSDCCWYGGCPEGKSQQVGTDISGTGFECAPDEQSDGDTRGSSTGWLNTSWPIEGGEVFTLTFHLHDTGDAIFDSEVILDAFQFLKKEDQGTQPTDPDAGPDDGDDSSLPLFH